MRALAAREQEADELKQRQMQLLQEQQGDDKVEPYAQVPHHHHMNIHKYVNV